MASPADNLPGPLKYQTWTLRVPIHCEGCKKKVKKILQKIDGVYMTTIDAQQHKVTVTGNIEARTLLQKLSKSGKPAELWADQSVKKENMLEAPSNEKEKTKAKKESDGKTISKNQKANGKATEGGQNKEKKSADNHANPAQTLKGGENSEKAPPLDGEKPVQLENAGGTAGVDGQSNGSNGDKKKKKKSKGNNGNAGNGDNPINPPASTPSPVSVPEAAPTIAPETPAPAPASVPQELPVPAESLVPAETFAPGPGPAPAPASTPAPTQAPAQAPGAAPVAGYSEYSMHHGKPIEPMNLGPSNNFGPPNQGYPQGPYHRPTDNFGPPSQQDYMYPPANYQSPQLGISYSMAQPSSSSSYYAQPYYSYEYPQYPMMHIPPPPPLNPINGVPDDDHYYNDNASQCRLM